MIGLLLVVAIILLLCLTTYFQQSFSLVDVVAWLAAAAAMGVAAWHLWKFWEGGAGGGPARPGARDAVAEGVARLRRGDVEAAERLLLRGLQQRPYDARAARGLAEIAWRRGDHEAFVQWASQALAQRSALKDSERVTLCHRQADACLQRLEDPQRAVEFLVRIEVDYPGSTEAIRARQRIERILSQAPDREHGN